MARLTISAALALVQEHLRAGRAGEAATVCRHVTAAAPELAEAWRLLGQATFVSGDHAAALEHLARAVQLDPQSAEGHENLSVVALRLKRWEPAEAAARRALDLAPDWPDAWRDLGEALRGQERWAAAEDAYRRALNWRPEMIEAYSGLAHVLQVLGRLPESEAVCRQGLALAPQSLPLRHNLALVLNLQGRWEDAAAVYRGLLDDAPNDAAAWVNLAALRQAQGQLDAALVCCHTALATQPDLPRAHHITGIVLASLGQFDAAQRHLQRALELDPQHAAAHGSLLQSLHYVPGLTRQEIAAEHARWNRQHGGPRQARWQPHENHRDPQRPLRLGFVSPDFAQHPVGLFLIQAFEAFDRNQCDLYCYSQTPVNDAITARFSAASHSWCDIRGVSDDLVTQRIRDDAIDVLFDLSGHTANNRLLVFAGKPAPLQFSWIGYEGSTELSAIDALIADERLVPPDAVEPGQRVLRLPGCYVTYDPDPQAPPVAVPPVLTGQPLTLGCFNNPAKLNHEVLAAWAEILQLLPAARLLLKYRGLDNPAIRQPLLQRWLAAGGDPNRVAWQGWSPRPEALAAYNAVDIALDPFPFSGGMTTCEALWMGVPVVTLPGETYASRHGLSYLHALGMTELTAAARHEYIAKVVDLARDGRRLADLRARLRPQLTASPLCNGARLAADLLALLRQEWQQWCAR